MPRLIKEEFSRDRSGETVNLTQTKKLLVTHVSDPTLACQLFIRALASELHYDTSTPCPNTRPITASGTEKGETDC